jgi:hypothetical protein
MSCITLRKPCASLTLKVYIYITSCIRYSYEYYNSGGHRLLNYIYVRISIVFYIYVDFDFKRKSFASSAMVSVCRVADEVFTKTVWLPAGSNAVGQFNCLKAC